MLSSIALFLFQSFMLAIMAIGIGSELLDVAEGATRMARLPHLHAEIHELSSVVFVAVTAFWLIAEANLLRSTLSSESRKKAENGNILSTLAPLLFFLGLSIAVIFIGGAGILVAAIAHIYIDEETASLVGLLASLAILAWIVYTVASTPTLVRQAVDKKKL